MRESPKIAYGPGKRLLADPFNKVIGLDDIYAIGDTSLQTHEPTYPNGHPQLAQVSIQQARFLAENFKSLSLGKQLKPFAYKDKGTMAIIGRNKAVADLPHNMHFKGFIAWFLWLFVHLISLINYRNRIKTLYNWTVAYLNKDQALRFIVRPGHTKRKLRFLFLNNPFMRRQTFANHVRYYAAAPLCFLPSAARCYDSFCLCLFSFCRTTASVAGCQPSC